jgi:hypothetical protein
MQNLMLILGSAFRRKWEEGEMTHSHYYGYRTLFFEEDQNGEDKIKRKRRWRRRKEVDGIKSISTKGKAHNYRNKAQK